MSENVTGMRMQLRPLENEKQLTQNNIDSLIDIVNDLEKQLDHIQKIRSILNNMNDSNDTPQKILQILKDENHQMTLIQVEQESLLEELNNIVEVVQTSNFNQIRNNIRDRIQIMNRNFDSMIQRILNKDVGTQTNNQKQLQEYIQKMIEIEALIENK